MRLHFTGGDLARTRVIAGYGPVAEAWFSVGVLQEPRPGLLFEGWQRSVDRSGWVRPLSQLTAFPYPLDLFTIMGPVATIDEAREVLLGAGAKLRLTVEHAATWAPTHGMIRRPMLPRWAWRLGDDCALRERFVAAVIACCSATVGPHWERLRAHLEADVARRTRLLAEGGVDRLLGTLHQDLRWQDGTLQICNWRGRPRDLYLGGRGLVLVPSVFGHLVTVPYISATDPDGPAVLFYPATWQISDAYLLWRATAPRTPDRPLAALLGRTRAAALDIVSDGCTTTELARRLRMSPATASQHAAVLRAAGLITTRRHGAAVLHSTTALGEALLNRAI